MEENDLNEKVADGAESILSEKPESKLEKKNGGRSYRTKRNQAQSRQGGVRRTMFNKKKQDKNSSEALSKEAVEKLPAVSKRTSKTTREVKPRSLKEMRNNAHGVKIIPLGGLEQIGMNITAIEYDNTIVVVDCGMAFPEDDMLGIDCVIPDITYLKDNIDKVKGFVITHGHEDHIGALPYVLREINVPVYATRLTIAIIESKLQEHGMLTKTKRKIVKYGQSINLGCMRVEFIRTNHSISDAAALAIYTPAGTIVHTGDFKVDYTPVFGDPIDLQRFGEIGRKGVLALMCDSTNILRPGNTMSEKSIGKTFETIFAENKTRRIIVATFASNVDRVQQIINSAEKYKRKVVIDGRSMVNIITIARELGYISIKDDTLISIDQMKNYKDDKLVLVTTGSQGEEMAALSRMAANIHKKVTIHPGDCIVFSSSPIPGNEKPVSKVINELTMLGAKVIIEDTHVSGHPSQEDVKLIYSLIKPKYAIPVHGEYRHLIRHKELAEDMGVAKDHIFVLKCGDILELDQTRGKITGHVQCGNVFVDGLGIGDVGNAVMKDRKVLSEDGLVITVVVMDANASVISGPDIISRGFVYVKEAEDLLKDARFAAEDALFSDLDRGVTDYSRLRNDMKDALSDFIWKQTKRSPMIIPIIQVI